MRAWQQLLRDSAAPNARRAAGLGEAGRAVLVLLGAAAITFAGAKPVRADDGRHDQSRRVIEKLDALRAGQGRLGPPQQTPGAFVPHGAWELRDVADGRMRRKDYAGAERALLDARGRYPKALGLLQDLAVVRAAAGDTDGAVAYYLEYLRAIPGDDAARLAMARTLSWSKEKRHLREAVRLLTEYLKDHPDAEEALLQRARTQVWLGDVPAAELDYRSFLARHPKRHDVELELATALSASKDPAFLARAIAIYDAALATTDDLDIRLARARLHSWVGNFDMAKVDYRLYLDARPRELGVKLELGRALSWSKSARHRSEAVAVLSEYLLRVPGDLDALRARGRAREWSADLEGAIADLRVYLRQRPDEEAEENLTRLLAQSSTEPHRAEAVTRLRRRLATHPADAEALLALAWILVDSRRPAERDEGIAILRPHLRLFPGDDRARLALARATAARNEPASLREALTYYDAYVQSHPDDLAQRLQRGRVRGWSGDLPGAVSDMLVYLKMFPGADDVRLEVARLIGQSTRPEFALPWFDDYLSRHPQDFSARMSRARALRWGRKYDEEEAYLEGLLRERRTTAERDEANLELARLYQETGRGHAALATVHRVLEGSPRNAEAIDLERRTTKFLMTVSATTQTLSYIDRQSNRVSAQTAAIGVPLDPRLGVLANAGVYSLGYASRSLVAGRANLGAFARVRDVSLQVAAGPRFYEQASAKAGGSAEVKVSPTWWSSAQADYQYDDIYQDLLAPASVDAGIRGHSFHVSGSAAFPWKGLRAVARTGGRMLDTGNFSFELTGTVTIPIWSFVSVGYLGHYLTWDRNSVYYWSPQVFTAHLGLVRANQAFAKGAFEYEVQALAGVASERVGAQSGTGLTIGFAGSLIYRPRPRVELLATVQYGQTIRSLPAAVADPARSETTTSRFWWLMPTVGARISF